ncbi:MAG TPA: cellulase family glycosylhydrolase [Nannocystis sp.]
MLTGLVGCGGAGSTAETAETSTTSGTSASTSGTPTTGGSVTDGPCAEPIDPVERSHARLRVDTMGVLRDGLGRDIQLRGVNAGGRSKWAPFMPFPMSEDASLDEVKAGAAAFFAPLPGWGLDTVRVPFSWEALEPVEGMYDERYLDRYVAMVDAAWALGLRVIVDFHQDVYASPFCGDGFPLWTISGEVGPPRRDCPDWGLGYIIDPGVREAFDRFWADEGGVQGKYRKMWEKMASRVATHPGVLALELINEPGWGTAPNINAWKASTLTPFHTQMIAHMRGVVGDELLLVFNNTGVEAAGLSPTVHMRPEGTNLMYGPHMYDGGLVGGELYAGHEPEVHMASLAEFSRAEGVAPLIGEFGYNIVADEAGTAGASWLTRVVDALDAERVSGTLWEYSRNEALWNEEDLSLVDAAGVPRPILDVYVRPYLRAVAGGSPSFHWDVATGTGVARWVGDGGVTEVVVPVRSFPDGLSELSLETEAGAPGSCYYHDAARGELRVRVTPGAQVELRFKRE